MKDSSTNKQNIENTQIKKITILHYNSSSVLKNTLDNRKRLHLINSHCDTELHFFFFCLKYALTYRFLSFWSKSYMNNLVVFIALFLSIHSFYFLKMVFQTHSLLPLSFMSLLFTIQRIQFVLPIYLLAQHHPLQHSLLIRSHTSKDS